MSVRLVLLGFLRGKPLHGYELKQMIERVMGDWTSIAFGSIYFALKKLTEEGFVEKIGSEQEGGRPSRTIYAITENGRREFSRLLREVWGALEQQYYEIDIGLSFMSALKPGEAEEYLRKRIGGLAKKLEYLDSHQAEELADGRVPKQTAQSVFGHHRAHLKAELSWTKDLLSKVEEGHFTEELEWIRGLFAGKGGR